MASKRQQGVAIGFLLLVLGASAIFLLLACIAMARSSISGENGIGWAFDLVVANGGAGIVGKSLLAILAVGAAYVADPDSNPAIFYLTAGLCVVALVSAGICVILLGDEHLAQRLYDWAPSGIDEAKAFGRAANLMLGGFIAWLLGVLSVQIGLKAT